MSVLVEHGIETISTKNSGAKDVSELKKKLSEKVKDSDFWIEANGTVLADDALLSELKGTVTVCYRKKYCDFVDCKLKRSKVCSDCRFCKYLFCGKHKMPEEHMCKEIKRCKEEANLKNANKLEEGRISKNKV
ncbi:putative Zinc finger, AN1-type protein [Trachipleistophora hominis]|uniref:Putative Zinc finger, AN1-type protein n=1 Tax=Trachipleistophora hominis TaxID=72359 RepID=L7JY50_TRAHO|nr:putative Zinc finger, AN1-type protein [Trachipleistophora hominis]